METPSSPSSDCNSGQTFRYREGDFIARGTFSRTFKGVFVDPDGNRDELPAAVKRVDFLVREESVLEYDPEVWALTTLSHPSLVKLYAAEDDWKNRIRTLVFEYCVASLEDYGESRYLGSMPDEKDGVYWMASGLDYLHRNKVAHWDINPSHILVSHHDNGAVRLKIGGFGSAKPLTGAMIDWVSMRSRRSQDYLAPELLLLCKDRNTARWTLSFRDEAAAAVDVFAAGCTIFYYLTKGAHPFGRSPMVVDNILRNNVQGLRDLPSSHWAMDTVTRMIEQNPDMRLNMSAVLERIRHCCNSALTALSGFSSRTDSIKFVDALSRSTADCIHSMEGDYVVASGFHITREPVVGNGSYGTIFHGWLKYKGVAIERALRCDTQTSVEAPFDGSLDHPNVLKLHCALEYSVFRYFVLEDYAANLRDVCEGRYPNPFREGGYKDWFPSEVQLLIQMAAGLDFIHSKKMAHGNVCPESVLISASQPAVIKWTSLHLTRPEPSTFHDKSWTTDRMETSPEWMSPEELDEKCREDVATAICVCRQREENSPVVCATESATEAPSFSSSPRAGTSENPWESRRTPAAKKMRLECKCADGGDFVPYRQARLLKRNQEEAVRSEVFSIGCLFFYFATKGFHPFHETGRSILNIIQGLAPNLKKLEADHLAFTIITQMIRREPEERMSLSDVIDRLRPLQNDTRTLATCCLSEKVYPLSSGRWGTDVFKMFFQGEMIAVKRIKRETSDDATNKDTFTCISHENLVNVMHFDQDSQFRYLGMELLAASLDQCFLPDDDPLKYRGPLPSDQQVLYQFAYGLRFIHWRLKQVHGQLKPSKVLISLGTNPSIKICHLGQINPASHLSLDPDYPKNFLAPELMQVVEGGPLCTTCSDVFAAGCIMLYFLSGGQHLEPRTGGSTEVDQTDLFEKLPKDHFAAGLIRWMTQTDPLERPDMSEVVDRIWLLQPVGSKRLTRVGNVEFSRHHQVTERSLGRIYFGRAKGVEVVVKWFDIMDFSPKVKETEVLRERDLLLRLDHPNVIKLIDYAENGGYAVMAIEKCLTDLGEYYDHPHLYWGVIPMPSDLEILLQLAQGLEYIHSKNIMHRDVKPDNLLISAGRDGGKCVIKWADFGLSKVMTDARSDGTFSHSINGTSVWFAPELQYTREDHKCASTFSSDIFSLGCVFFFVLVPGVHPFGECHLDQWQNIRNGNPVNVSKHADEPRPPIFHLVEQMIVKVPENRPALSVVIEKIRSMC